MNKKTKINKEMRRKFLLTLALIMMCFVTTFAKEYNSREHELAGSRYKICQVHEVLEEGTEEIKNGPDRLVMTGPFLVFYRGNEIAMRLTLKKYLEYKDDEIDVNSQYWHAVDKNGNQLIVQINALPNSVGIHDFFGLNQVVLIYTKEREIYCFSVKFDGYVY